MHYTLVLSFHKNWVTKNQKNMDAAIMLQRRMRKTRAVNFYDCTVGIWGGENFMSDVLEEGGQSFNLVRASS